MDAAGNPASSSKRAQIFTASMHHHSSPALQQAADLRGVFGSNRIVSSWLQEGRLVAAGKLAVSAIRLAASEASK
jgi:hypothetical protein